MTAGRVRVATRVPARMPHWRFFVYHSRPLGGSVAQSVEQRPFKALVVGSSPTRPILMPSEPH
jgi:hypothetical protein